MINIRYNIFETNSSSTHALVVMTKDQYNRWQDDNYLCVKNDELIPPDEIEIKTREEVMDDLDLTQEEIDNMGNYQLLSLLECYGYLPAENYNSVVGEFDNYVILSAYISD